MFWLYCIYKCLFVAAWSRIITNNDIQEAEGGHLEDNRENCNF